MTRATACGSQLLDLLRAIDETALDTVRDHIARGAVDAGRAAVARGGPQAPVRPSDPESALKDSPLRRAARRGFADAARLLLEAGVEVDAASDTGGTALHFACGGGHAEMVAVLLVAGAAVDQAADGGFTPLLIACQEGHDKVVAVLLAVNWPSVQQ